MRQLVFEVVPESNLAKQVVGFWNQYGKEYNTFKGNGCKYNINFNSNWKILDYDCESLTLNDAKIYKDTLPEFMQFPEPIRDKMIERSIFKSPIPFILDIMCSSKNGGFDWNEQPEGEEFWLDVIDNRDFDLFYKHFNLKEDESRLSEQESPLRRGSSNITSGIRCRKYKARVTVVSPGYQKITGRG